METTLDNSIAITKEVQASITPDQALQMLKDGNERFVNNNQLQRDLGAQVQQTGQGQAPFAAVVGCIDSRVPAEVVFDQGIGDIFNARIAGNFVNTDILGSLEFACKVAGSKAIVVLGHTKCGAIRGAVDDVELGNLTSMLSHLKPAVAAVTDEDDSTSNNPAFLGKVGEANVRLTVQNIKDQSPILNEMLDSGEIALVGAIYNVETGKVSFMEG